MVTFAQNITQYGVSSIPFLPGWIIVEVYQTLGLNEFYLRLPNVLVLLMSFLVFYYGAKRLFGLESTELTLLIVASSFLVPAMAKMATSDIWLMASHLSIAICLIRCIKQNQKIWLFGFYGSLVLAMFIHLISTFIFVLVLLSGLYFFHPKGRMMNKWLLMGPPLLILVGLFTDGLSQYGLTLFLGTHIQNVGLNWWQYLLVLFLGLLPWLGFVPAVLWDLVKKMRAREELAIIGGCCILAGLLSKSLVPTWFLALFIGKHLMAFLSRKYPYGRSVLFFALTNMVLTFFAAFLMMMSGYLQFESLGFRSAVSVGATYWMFSLLGVIGLLGRNKAMTISGLGASALFAFFLFWSNVYPIIENSRGLSQQLVDRASLLKQDTQNDQLVLQAGLFPELQNLKVYAREKSGFVIMEQSVDEIYTQRQASISIVEKSSEQKWSDKFDLIELSGRPTLFGEEKTFLIMKRK